MGKSNIEFHKELMKDLPQAYLKWFRADEEYLKNHVKPNSKVLDVGCGEGRGLGYVLGAAKDLVGLDHDKKAIELARKRFKNYPNVKIIFGEAVNLPFKNNSFDHVICVGSLVNFGKVKEKALKEMKRVVKSDGNIIASVFSEDALSERLKLYKKLQIPIKEVKKNGTVIFDDFVGDNISEQFSKDQLKQLFKNAELNLKAIKKVGIGYICELTKNKIT